MEKEKSIRSGGRKFLIALGVIIIAFLVYYLVMAILTSGKEIKSLADEYGYKADPNNKTDERIFKDSLYLALMKEKAFEQARVSMAETDSIYLTVNVPDSTIDLEISGVSVHSSAFKKIRVSRMLRTGDEYVLSSLFSRPFTVAQNYSSIKKVPLVIKMAPKDTSEFKPDIIVDTTDYEPVNYMMQADNGIRIFVYQAENLNPGDKKARFMFDLGIRFRDFADYMTKVCTFKVPEYHPFIKMRMPRTSAKIFYRALPEHGQITFNM